MKRELNRGDAETQREGDRIGWVLYFARADQPHATVEVWVCGLDGSRMHSIGSIGVERPKPDEDWNWDWPYEIQWQPDGKHLSFIYRDALCSVPAD